MSKSYPEEKPLPPLPKNPPFAKGLPSNPREAKEKNVTFSSIRKSEDPHRLPYTNESDVVKSRDLFQNVNLKELTQVGYHEYDEVSLQEEPILPSYSRHDYWSFTQGLEPSSDAHPLFESSRIGWKPITLRAPVLLTVGLISLCFIVILQWLAYKSRKNSGILFASSLQEVSARDTFIYLYAPVVVAVLYSISWTWIDLDTKRVEPYLRLCHRDGATANDSIFLNYATDFVALVPFKAARRRHWAVFSAGLSLVTVFWAITPLTSAIFNLNEIPISSKVQIVDSSRIMPIENQINMINANIFNDVYNYQWHNLSLPPFTTTDRVIIPFDVFNNTDIRLPEDGVITSNAISYFTKLVCAPAQYINDCKNSFSPDSSPGPGISNGRGCSTPAIVPQKRSPGTTYTLEYVGWYSMAQGFSLSDIGCPCNNSRSTFLASWDSASYNPTTAPEKLFVFCDTAYFSQLVEATVRANDGSVLKVDPIQDPVPLEPRLLNTSNFEYLLGTVVAALSEEDTSADGGYGTKGADIVDSYVLDERPRVVHTTPNVTLSLDIGGYALTAQGGNISSLGDPKVLASAFEKAHQLLFTMAVPRFWIPELGQPPKRPGSYKRVQAVVTVDTVFASATSGVLLVVGLLAIVLLRISSRRPSFLCEDPASIISNMRLMSGSFQEFVSSRSNQETKTNTPKSFCIRQNPVTTLPQLEYTQNYEHQPTVPSNPASQESQPAANPIELKSPSLSILITMLSTSIMGLCVLKWKISRDNGLHVPSENTFLSRTVLSYAPTAFATLMESYWVLLTRTSSYLWPFEDLRRGNALKRRTIGAAYTSLPPQLILLGSIRNKHATLSLLCVVAVLANLLSVAMSGLFQTVNTPIAYPVLLTQGYESAMKYTSTASNNEYDYVYTLASSISGGNTTPPWVDERYVFNPFTWNNKTINLPQVPITGQSTGVILNVSCSSYQGQYKHDMCREEEWRPDDKPIAGADGKGRRLAAEFVSFSSPGFFQNDLQNTTDSEEGGFSATWCRTNPRANETVLFAGNATVPAMTGSRILCKAWYNKAEFNVTVDESGRVLSFNQISASSNDTMQIFGNASNSEAFASDAIQVLTASHLNVMWHNDTFAADWFNYLLKVLTNSSSIVDPEASLPSDSTLERQTEDVLERLFAVYAGLNPVWLFASERTPNRTFQGTFEKIEQRVFFSTYMFQISLALLCLNLSVAVVLWIRRPKRYLEEMPTTIAAIGSCVAYSNLLAEVKHESIDDRRPSLSGDVQIGFGKFIGTDGKPHVGIERHPLVTIL